MALHPGRRDRRSVAGLPTTSRSSTATLSWGSREGDEDGGHGGRWWRRWWREEVCLVRTSRRGLLNPTELCSRRNNVERKLGKPMVFLFEQKAHCRNHPLSLEPTPFKQLTVRLRFFRCPQQVSIFVQVQPSPSMFPRRPGIRTQRVKDWNA